MLAPDIDYYRRVKELYSQKSQLISIFLRT